MIQFPPTETDVLMGKGFSRSWLVFFRSLYWSAGGAKGGTPVSITPTASPFSYAATQNGNVTVSGTVSSIALVRGSTTASVTGGCFHLRTGDVLTVTYTGSLTMWSFPD